MVVVGGRTYVIRRIEVERFAGEAVLAANRLGPVLRANGAEHAFFGVTITERRLFEVGAVDFAFRVDLHEEADRAAEKLDTRRALLQTALQARQTRFEGGVDLFLVEPANLAR